ncbi:hypothetical protein M758_1G197800 [Ceratodon purpureus]|uniref:Uncharacterized protein n=1 Tax=Ceratodon purpureus TaxID=3225 RepID=A0A8T0JAV9_CERPU|nr:hypothetical protein KC19_1G223100 [Ceratodon purpureus]KAG0630697.1 hypothetical protein M758_1G197800 [Ceratodon purpureus]
MFSFILHWSLVVREIVQSCSTFTPAKSGAVSIDYMHVRYSSDHQIHTESVDLALMSHIYY